MYKRRHAVPKVDFTILKQPRVCQQIQLGTAHAGESVRKFGSHSIITAKGSVRQLNILLALNEITQ